MAFLSEQIFVTLKDMLEYIFVVVAWTVLQDNLKHIFQLLFLWLWRGDDIKSPTTSECTHPTSICNCTVLKSCKHGHIEIAAVPKNLPSCKEPCDGSFDTCIESILCSQRLIDKSDPAKTISKWKRSSGFNVLDVIQKFANVSSPTEGKTADFPLAESVPETLSSRHFIWKQKLGAGGFGSVYSAILKQPTRKDRTVQNGMEVAVKVINLRRTRLKLASKEIRIHTLVSHHPNIVTLLSSFHENKYCCIVMECQRGGTVQEELQRRGNLQEVVVLKIMFQVFNAIAYLHDLGIAHLDIKGSNVLLGERLTGSTSDVIGVRVVDFGLSVCYISNPSKINKRVTKGRRGTKGYMAPELKKRRAFRATAVDMWAAGTLMFELLTGNLPVPNEETCLSLEFMNQYACHHFQNWNELNDVSFRTRNIIASCLRYYGVTRPPAEKVRQKINALLWNQRRRS